LNAVSSNRLVVLHHQLDGARTNPPLILLHALGTDLRVWDEVARLLSADCWVIRGDLRGHGRSPLGPAGANLNDFADDVASLLVRLGIKRAVFGGVSLGGLVALAVARRYPAGVSGLVTCSASARIGSHESWTQRMELVSTHGMERAAKLILPRWFAPDFAAHSPAICETLRGRLARTSLDGYLAACQVLRDADLRRELDTIKVPTLVIAGEHDLATPPESLRAFAAALPKGRFAGVAGAGHLPPVEKPDAVAGLIRQFMEEIS
jgi:3-oxoadipate enol-lactonase